MSEIVNILSKAVEHGVSDIFIIAGFPIAFKKHGEIRPQNENHLTPADTEGLIRDIFKIASRDMEPFYKNCDDDFSIAIPGLSRFRVSTYKQRGSFAAVIRIVSFGIPDYRKMNIPEAVMTVAKNTKGLVLVTGPTGSGKSTTLACVIDRINSTRSGHIITLEDPIEFLFKNKMSIVSQREISLDTDSYVMALRACLRQAPNVIFLGEMRDFETIRTALTAAETGHLVISTLHTVGAANTVDRIVDVFPSEQQQQIRVQLAMLLRSVVSQQLVPTIDGSAFPVFEIMHGNSAVRNIIRDSKAHQLDSIIATSMAEGMMSMDSSLADLYKRRRITREVALRFATNPDSLSKKLF